MSDNALTSQWDDPTRIERLGDELRQALDRLPEATMALFSAPAPDADDADARQNLAMAVAERAGLKPWPEWAAVRHGVGHGAHVLNIVHELGRTGRAQGVAVCFLAPVEASLLTQAAVVAHRLGLEFIAIGEVAPS